MGKAVEVKLWGRTVGYLWYLPDQTEIATFTFDEAFVNSEIEISPIEMPNRIQQHSFDTISRNTFKGLPGVFADSLPDKYGGQLIDQYMADKGIDKSDITALDRLMYIGNRGMGALEYHPVEPLSQEQDGGLLDLKSLVELSSMVLSNEVGFREKLADAQTHEQAIRVLRVGSSAGGARAKALIAISPDKKIYDGTRNFGVDYSYWLLKFDSDNNQDRDRKDPKGMTRIEYIYSKIAKACGINMPRTDYIVDERGDFHYLIERFDREKNNKNLRRLHFASWCGLEHANRDVTGVYSYSQLILLNRKMNLGQTADTEIFRRAVFNIIGRNHDDHTKNFGYLMGQDGVWSLSPAFDMTYQYDPAGKWTQNHQIQLNKKASDFIRQDLIDFGNFCNLSQKKAESIIEKTLESFQEFSDLAQTYEVPEELQNTVRANQRINL